MRNHVPGGCSGESWRRKSVSGQRVGSTGDDDYKLFMVDGLLQFPRKTKETFMQPMYFRPLVENTM